MRRLLMSTVALVFLTMPGLAQPGTDRGDRAHTTPQAQNRGQAAPPHQMAPQQGSSPIDRGHGGDRGSNRGAAQRAAPVMQPQAAPQNRVDRGRIDRRGQTGGNTNFGNRPGGQNFGNRPGGTVDNRRPRRDFSSFRDFHRSFNAPRRFQAPAYRRPNGWYDHRWSFGEFLPSLFWAPSYWLNDYYRYGLPPPPYGAVWVREGYDALLIDRDSGEIITIVYDVFY